MSVRALVHIMNDDPIMCELERVPNPSDSYVVIRNPRRRDGKPMELLADGATSFLYPWSRITFIELFEDEGQREGIVGFFRESGSGRNHP
ncbi:MAG: hypothetical protein H0V47_05695 [Chloroflexia bacterium]|jgi:hypothetical protein|nr:hypothetical protein [Chloroflexia bacterium]